MRVTGTKILAAAMREMAAQIHSPDNFPEIAILEASQRIEDLADIAAEMAGMIEHDNALSEHCKACSMKKRLAKLGVAAW